MILSLASHLPRKVILPITIMLMQKKIKVKYLSVFCLIQKVLTGAEANYQIIKVIGDFRIFDL